MQSLCRREFASLFSEGFTAEADPAPWAARRRRDILFRDSYRLRFRRSCDNIRTAFRLVQSLGPAKFLKVLSQPLTADAPDHRSGFCGIGGALSTMPFIGAYARGRYPQPFFGKFSWWSPATRSGVVPRDAKTAGETDAVLAGAAMRVTFDRDFDAVVAACSHRAPGTPSAWLIAEPRAKAPALTPAHMHLLAALHDLGIAHSFEVWDGCGGLVGGGYGISVGAVFVCEDFFARSPEVAMAGLTTLNRHLALWEYVFCDLKTVAPPVGLPITVLDRGSYEQLLADHLGGGRYRRWRTTAQNAGGNTRTRQPPAPA
jgi:leucyl/phenylalanyl-tRNA--protein transferase